MDNSPKTTVVTIGAAAVSGGGIHWELLTDNLAMIMGAIALLSLGYQIYSTERSSRMKKKHYDLVIRERHVEKRERDLFQEKIEGKKD